MSLRRFEDLIAWQKARALTREVLIEFGDSKPYGFRDQITRAAISIPNNIAEGFARKSPKDFRRFLLISLGSSEEVKSMIYTAEDLKLINQDRAKALRTQCTEVSAIISGLHKSIRVDHKI